MHGRNGSNLVYQALIRVTRADPRPMLNFSRFHDE